MSCWQLIYGCRVFNNYKNSDYKKLRRNRKKFEIFFVKFKPPFSQKIINIQLYISCMWSFHTFNSLTLVTDKWYILKIISLLIEKKFHLLRPQSFSFQIVSEFTDTFVKLSNFMSQGWGFWLPVLSRGEGFCTQWLSHGRVFTPFNSCIGEMILDEIDTCIT